LHPNVRDVTPFESKEGAHGYVGYDLDTNSIIVTFRGTTTAKDYIYDFNFFHENFKQCQDCKIHRGFWTLWLSIKDRIIPLCKALIEKYPKAKLHLTGHSLGGSLVTLLSLELRNLAKIDSIYTFGMPRLGNKNLADWIKKTSSPKIFRVTHDRDPVPHLPPQLFGFHHYPYEIFYNKKWEVTICNDSGEDPKCANSVFLPLNGTEHPDYYNMYQNDYIICRP